MEQEQVRTQTWADRLSAFCTAHLSQRQFILLLSFMVGIGTALAAQILKWLIHEIETMLTAQFDITHANWLF